MPAATSICPAQAQPPGPALSGGVTVIGLGADDDASQDEISASLDLFIDLQRGPGTLHIFIEGNTTPRSQGVALLVPEAVADAGTALNRDGEGRLQISELKYAFSLAQGRTLDAGLLDVTAYLDTTRIDNDENMQFLGASFLNNPTIEFPDYTIGVVYHQEPHDRGPALSVALTSSEGLADNPNASYEELFEFSRAGKGIFAGAEAGWQTQAQRYRLGAWVNSADHRRLNGSPGTDVNYGLYTTIGGSRGRHSGSIRLGIADRSVSPAEAFASLTYQRSWERIVLGFGAARTWSSSELPGVAPHTTHLETYLRRALSQHVFLTPSLQYVRGSAFRLAGPGEDEAVLVYALRLRAQF